jgi:hypothetical protein
MMPHDDMSQDADMIKTVLQKIIDEMNGFEANRIMPDSHKPKMMAAKVDISANPIEETQAEMPDENSSEMKPDVLKELLDKAGTADDSGSLPEDNTEGLHPSIAALVAEKRKKLV